MRNFDKGMVVDKKDLPLTSGTGHPIMNMSEKETKVQYTKIFQATILIILNIVQAGTLLIIANLLSQILNLLNQLNV